LGVLFLRYDPNSKAEDLQPPKIEIQEGLLKVEASLFKGKHKVTISPDLLVLASSINPSPSAKSLSEILKVPRTEDGFFLEAHMKLQPVDFSSNGIHLCGGAHSPKNISESITQAAAAAGRAMITLSKENMTVGPIVSVVDKDKCATCLTCARACPYNIPTPHEEGQVEIEVAQCRGCGICASVCPGKAITLQHFSDEQISAMCHVTHSDRRETFEPNIVAFCCNYCAYTAADLAGSQRLDYPTSVRILRLPCSGRADMQFAFDALKDHADGVLILGCMEGDCHFDEGNIKAKKRVTYIRKLLDETGIGEKRLKMDNVPASSGIAFAEAVTSFTEKIKELGPNPALFKEKESIQ
jgi:heterodisulfide reductase subunit A